MDYARQSILNPVQACQGPRYLYSHPDINHLAPRGSARHRGLSLIKRSGLVVSDLFHALILPHWHHTSAQLAAMHRVPFGDWPSYGYQAWVFTTGLTDPDRRWDPLCLAPDIAVLTEAAA